MHYHVAFAVVINNLNISPPTYYVGRPIINVYNICGLLTATVESVRLPEHKPANPAAINYIAVIQTSKYQFSSNNSTTCSICCAIIVVQHVVQEIQN